MKFRFYQLFWILIVITFLGNSNGAEAHMIRRLTHSDGLPSSSVMSVLSAENGFLWLGTVDGLGIYDGHFIHNFNSQFSPDNLSGNLIHSIHETKDAMWIQTNYGLDRLSKENSRIENFDDFRENKTFVSDNKDVMIALGDSNKLYYYVEGESKAFQPLEGLTTDHLVTVTLRGDTLNVYQENGIRRFLLDKKKGGNLGIIKQLPFQEFRIDRCFPDYDGKMWIAEPSGVIWLYDQASGNKEKIADLSDERKKRGPIFSIARHKESNELFVGFQWNDCLKLSFNNNGTDPEVTELGINSGIVKIEPDCNQEVMWIITDGQGAYEYIDADVSIRSLKYSDLNNLIKRPVRALWVDNDDTLWIGTKGDGILRLKNIHKSPHARNFSTDLIDTSNSSLLHKEVYSFSSSRRPILWIGTAAGLNYYSYADKQIKVLPFSGVARPRDIHSIYEESDSILWVAASGQGIYRIKLEGTGDNPVAKGVKSFSNDNGNWALNFFFAIHPGKDGVMYGVNRGYGAVEIKDDEMTMLPLYNDYPSRMVNDMFAVEVQGDTLWYGTGAGVIRKIGKDETYYDRSAGLSNTTIHAMILTDDKDLWMSTNDGLACLDTETGNIKLYNHSSGVEINEFSDGAFCRNGNDIYFGGVDGIVKVSMGSESSPSTVDYAPVYFTGIIIGGKYHNLNTYRTKSEVKIPHNENSFSIELASPDHINGSHYAFYYKLEKDKDWNVAENHRVTFSHLPYGSYKLMARYIDNATGYTSPVYSLDFKVLAPWYLSWWMKTVYSILVLAALSGAIYYMLWRQRRDQKRRIKELKRDQKEKMYENKLRFFTGITHEFSAPLTLIYGPCERILSHRGIDSYTQRYINLIRHNAERLNSLIQEIIDFGRIENGVMPRIISDVNVSMLCTDTLQLFTSLEEQNSVHLERDIEPNLMWPTDVRSFTKILYNLISNAFKYTPSYGTIRLSLHNTGDKLQLKVYNTGKGISDKDKKRIFDRYTVFENMEENATKGLSSRNGLGMATCEAMVEHLEGEIEIRSEIGKYAEFVVTLPALPLSSTLSKDVIDEGMPIIQPQSVEMPELPEAPKQEMRSDNNDNKELSILIIDDDAEILHLLTDAMTPQFEVYTAINAQEGLKIVKEKNPDIIITDIMMAGEGGIWFTKKVKEDRLTTHIPIVMLSAKSTSVDKIAGLKAGADAYVAKPFSTGYLLEVVNRLLSSRGELKNYYKSSASAFEYMDGKAMNQPDKDFIKGLKEVVEESIRDSELTADILAEKMGMSTRNLYRKMKTLQLPPPIDFIRQHRIKHAAHLLATTSLSIQDVLIESGFNNRSYFYKEFDKVYGMTPKAYRLQEQNILKKED